MPRKRFKMLPHIPLGVVLKFPTAIRSTRDVRCSMDVTPPIVIVAIVMTWLTNIAQLF